MSLRKNSFYKMMLSIAVPVALQNMITSCLNMLDTVMISSLGTVSIAGVGLANQIFFFYILICFGINTGSSVVISQYFGKKDKANVQRVNGLAVLLCLITGGLFTLVAFFFPTILMGILTKDHLVIIEGAKYLKVVSLSYVLTAISGTYGTSLRSTGQPNAPLAGSILSFMTNAFFNYVLIFGRLGFPSLGVEGAAIATVVARGVEFCVIIPYTHRYKGPLNATLKQMFHFDTIFVRNYLVILTPVILNETFWSLGQVIYNIAYAMTGTESTAAIQVATSIQNMLFIIIRGLSSSCTIMIGQQIGRGELDGVFDLAKRFIRISLVVGMIMGMLVHLLTDLLLVPYGNLSPHIYQMAVLLLRVMGIFYTVKAFNSIMVVGILRGGGDTKFSMYMETACVWLIGVPLSLVAVKVLNLSIVWVMCFVMMDEVCKAIIGIYRFKSKKWIKQVI